MTQSLKLKNKATGKFEVCTMRPLIKVEIVNVLCLQDEIYDQLPNKDVFFKDSMMDYIHHIESGGEIIGVFNEDSDLIAFRSFSIPGALSFNLGHDLKLSEDDRINVVHFETTVVHPNYRGNRLQVLTFDMAKEYIQDFNKKHLICTISPDNPKSLLNMMSKGFIIKELKFKYEVQGRKLLRFILYKGSLTNNETLKEKALQIHTEQLSKTNDLYVGIMERREEDELVFIESITIELSDAVRHMEALANGFLGAHLTEDGKIVYIKMQEVDFNAGEKYDA